MAKITVKNVTGRKMVIGAYKFFVNQPIEVEENEEIRTLIKQGLLQEVER